MSDRIGLRPIGLRAANAFVMEWHRHHGRVVQACWCIGAFVDGNLVGVAIVESPKANALRAAGALEVTRLSTDGTRNVATRLLGRVTADALSTGVRRLVSYTRIDELGTCYRAAGWRPVATVSGRRWDEKSKPGRWLPGLFVETTETIDRVRWEIGPDAAPELDSLASLGRRRV